MRKKGIVQQEDKTALYVYVDNIQRANMGRTIYRALKIFVMTPCHYTSV